ncbi:MAG: glycosyltransferase family 4 protein [Ruminococcaceae bacterium]|nr:glycosyltransferase family 4 protein [Oscillospiraceae bacterium]
MSGRILFVSSNASHLRNFHIPYIKALQERGYVVDAACAADPKGVPQVDHVYTLSFVKKMTSPQNFAAVLQLRKLLLENRYDFMCCHTSLAAYFARLAAMSLGKKRPVVCNMMHGYLFDERSNPLKRALLASAEAQTRGVTDLLLTMNRWDTDYAEKRALGRRIAFVPGVGVHFDRFDAVSDAEGAAFRAELGVGAEQFLLVYAAEFSGRKNQETLIRAMTELPKEVVLAMPGQGDLWEACRALATELGVADRVILPGQVSNVPFWYRAADAAVSSSRSEGLPFNVMEAMYCSLPVVATEVKGHVDLVEDGVSGFLFPYGDSAAFAGHIRTLLADRARCAAMGAEARRQVLPYGLDTVMPQAQEQYLSCLPEREEVTANV